MKIAEISEKYGLTADTLRYYEKIGLLPNVRRKGGARDYDENDCKWIEFIKCMRSAGIPIEVLIRYVSLFQQGEATEQERKQLLINERDSLVLRIEELNKTLERLNYKIDNYSRIQAVQNKLKK